MRYYEILNESKSSPLFHGTTIENLYNILKNGIEPRTSHNSKRLLTSSNLDGVSTSRNINIAKWLGNRQVVLVLDQQKLSQIYKIIPVKYNDLNDESEEFIVTRNSINMKYVSDILINEELLHPEVSSRISKELDKIKVTYPEYYNKFKFIKF